jgi:hypothetical protein
MATEPTKQDSGVSDTSNQGLESWIENHILGDLTEEKEVDPEHSAETPPEEDLEKTEDEPLEEEPKEPEEPETEDKEPEAEEPKPDPIQKRIDKLTAQKKAAEEKAAELEEKLAKQEPQKEIVLTPSKADPLSDVLSVSDLEKRTETVERLREHCLRNPDGFTYTQDGKDIFVTPEEVREHIVETDRSLRKDIPARQKWLDQYAASVADAKKIFPALFDSRTAEYQTAQGMLNHLPELKRIPSYNYVIGCAILGEKTIQANATKAKTAKVDTSKDKVPTTPTASAGNRADASKKSDSKLTSKSTKEDLLNAISDRFLSGVKFK